jgi:FKBP-type peptidyl-prolyl cis-trans isomerase FkpA
MKNILPVLLVMVAFTSCFKEPKCEYDECAVKAPDAEIQSLQAYLQQNNINATQHCSGTFYTIQQQGGGNAPTPCGGVSVTYKGTLTDGTVFDQTPAGQQATFSLGTLIPGFKNGVLQLKTGGKMTIYVPPSLGYGARQQGNIPPNSVLIFQLELLAAQ